MRKTFVIALSAALTSITFAASAEDNKALQQLKDATSGSKSTGKTFDNNDRPQQMNAWPRDNTNVPSVSGKPVDTSSGTASGFTVSPSTGTASGATAKKTGTESTKK